MINLQSNSIKILTQIIRRCATPNLQSTLINMLFYAASYEFDII
ncbi:hypothetical protein [Okeania sp. SIO1I7]|nr:hypothetical protein [Okeania sp. SIO1I7]